MIRKTISSPIKEIKFFYIFFEQIIKCPLIILITLSVLIPYPLLSAYSSYIPAESVNEAVRLYSILNSSKNNDNSFRNSKNLTVCYYIINKEFKIDKKEQAYLFRKSITILEKEAKKLSKDLTPYNEEVELDENEALKNNMVYVLCTDVYIYISDRGISLSYRYNCI